MSKIAIYEGYTSPFEGYGKAKRKRKSGGKTAHQRKFAKAARSCRGKSKGAFKKCMRIKLRK